VRYQTPIGPLRFDFGYNLNPPAFSACTSITPPGQCTPQTPPAPQYVVQRAGHFNFSFSVGQSF
jgi:outer membrane protein assembly factor BamA